MSLFVGLLSRIVVRKMGRRAADGGKQTKVKVRDGADGGGGGITDRDDVSTQVNVESADVAREQFPFIFNLLRGHAITSQSQQQGLGPGEVSAAAAAADTDSRRPGKTSLHHHPQHQHEQQLQLQLQQPARKPSSAVAACRQRQATPSGRGTLRYATLRMLPSCLCCAFFCFRHRVSLSLSLSLSGMCVCVNRITQLTQNVVEGFL